MSGEVTELHECRIEKKKDNLIVRAYKALLYTDDHKHFSRKALMNVSAFFSAFVVGGIITFMYVHNYIVSGFKLDTVFAGVILGYWGTTVLGMALQYTYGKKIDIANGNGESNDGNKYP